MKGTTNPILNAFDGNHKELFIPVYQRNYDWQIKQCERLFQDLEDIISVDRKKHFFGAVVGKPKSWKWIVIDGQQRLTTVSLLMLALANALRDGDIESEDDELAEKIEMDYLRIGATKKRTRFKLKPVKDDDKAYQRLFGPEKEFINSSNITANYKYFRERIAQTSLNADQLWDAICRLEVMHLDLEEYDDAQRIFESLNSTGLELKEADKIRNFVLMGHDSATQTHLYEDRWNPIEENSDFETDAFIRWYLTTKTARTPKEQDVYEAFKTHVIKAGKSTEEILDDLYEFSSYYRKIRRASTGDQRVNALLRRMNPIRGAVTIPFLMPVLRAVENGETTYGDLYNVLKIIEAFVTRRFIVGIATNSLNKIFATAFSDVSKLRTGDQSMAEIFAYTLLRRSGSGRFPNDAEFKEAFATKNMYALRAAWREYLFDVLENGDSNDNRDIAQAMHNGDITVEHIMPQTLTADWKDELGEDAEEIHETWLHRIGNLTVTGYNPFYSNSSYERKKTMEHGFEDSPYRLNDMLKANDSWGLEQMKERTAYFADRALKYWQTPVTDFEPPATVLPTLPMGEEGSFKGREIVAFQYGDLHQTVESWAEMVQLLLNFLMRDRRTEMLSYVKDYGPLRVIEAEEETPAEWRRVDDVLIVFTANNTDSKLGFLRALFEHLDIDPEELVFSLRPGKGDVADADDAPGAVEEQSEDKPESYVKVTKYLAEFEEAVTLKSSLESTVELREQFAKDFAQFAREDAAAVLERKPIFDFVAAANPEEASEAVVLAVITQILAAGRMVGQGYVHQVIVDGTLGEWVKQLSRF